MSRSGGRVRSRKPTSAPELISYDVNWQGPGTGPDRKGIN